MKTIICGLLGLMLLFSGMGRAQNISAVKIDSLEKYIQDSQHPLIVNFWATWCGPCTREIPYFEKLAALYKKEGVELILVSLDFESEFPKGLANFVKKQQYQSKVIWLNETNADYFCPKIDSNWSGAIPATLFIHNKTGYRNFYGRQLTEPQLEIELKNLVKE